MHKGRLEAFSDGVIAIIITIMVLELKVPHGSAIADLLPIIPVFLSYVLSFIYVGIYWSNHHHLLQITENVGGGTLWANLHLLFWLSLIPFATAWAGENHFASGPVLLYGVVLCMCSIAYTILAQQLVRHHGPGSRMSRAIGSDRKGRISVIAYLAAIGIAAILPMVSGAIYVGIAILWLIPDRRVEKVLDHPPAPK
jgi:uncharacterized membrane protein